MFLQELEGDKEMRSNINVYKKQNKSTTSTVKATTNNITTKIGQKKRSATSTVALKKAKVENPTGHLTNNSGEGDDEQWEDTNDDDEEGQNYDQDYDDDEEAIRLEELLDDMTLSLPLSTTLSATSSTTQSGVEAQLCSTYAGNKNTGNISVEDIVLLSSEVVVDAGDNGTDI